MTFCWRTHPGATVTLASVASREAVIDETRTQRTLALADTWRRGIARTNYVPLSAKELRSVFASLAGEVLSGLSGDADPAARGRDLGAALVGIGYTSAEALGSTIAILAGELQSLAPIHSARVAALLSGFATGFTAASQRRLLDDQEATRRAVLEEN